MKNLKKTVTLILAFVLVLALLCPLFALSSSAAPTPLEDAFSKAEKKIDGFVKLFTYRMESLPITASPTAFLETFALIDGEEKYIGDAADIEVVTEGGSEAFRFVLKDKEYSSPVAAAILETSPFLTVTEKNDGADFFYVLAELPGMNADLYEVMNKLIDAYSSDAKSKIAHAAKTSLPQVIRAGGGEDDIKKLEKTADDAQKEVSRVCGEYTEKLRQRREAYLSEHPEDGDLTGSVFSGGSLTVIFAIVSFVAVAALAFLGGMYTEKNKEKRKKAEKTVDN